MDAAAVRCHDGPMTEALRPSRRAAALALAGAAALAVAPWRPARAESRPPAVEALILAFSRGAPLLDAGLTLDMDDSVDDGSSVPVALIADSPMTDADHVEAILLVAPANPLLTVAEFRFTPASGRATVRTRIRMAKSQTLIALARTTTGAVMLAERRVEVVANGCVG
jgi:sulfur-oxidizing protein SoxY